ncbi:MAG: AAA family ATPase [Pseudomonadota bacterium]
MKFFLIHGAPATGKLTVARELASLTGLPLVDNHAAIDMARMVFGFAQPGFWDLVHDLRVTTLHGASRAHVSGLITTAAYSHPEDALLLRDYDHALEEHGGVIEPIHLFCAEDTLMERVSGSERAKKGKISSPEGLRCYLDRNNFVAIPRSNCLSLSTENTTPLEVAAAIAKHFQIPVVSGE